MSFLRTLFEHAIRLVLNSRAIFMSAVISRRSSGLVIRRIKGPTKRFYLDAVQIILCPEPRLTSVREPIRYDIISDCYWSCRLPGARDIDGSGQACSPPDS